MIYKRVKRAFDTGYTKNGVFIKGKRVPKDVKVRLVDAEQIEVPDFEGKTCLFCEAKSVKQRILNGLLVELCEHHYYSQNIGRIAQELREQEGERNGIDAKVSATRRKKRKSKITKS